MPKMREPRDLAKYTSTEDAAEALDDIVAKLRRRPGRIKWSLSLTYWNPAWLDPNAPKPEVIVTNIKLCNKEQIRR